MNNTVRTSSILDCTHQRILRSEGVVGEGVEVDLSVEGERRILRKRICGRRSCGLGNPSGPSRSHRIVYSAGHCLSEFSWIWNKITYLNSLTIKFDIIFKWWLEAGRIFDRLLWFENQTKQACLFTKVFKATNCKMHNFAVFVSLTLKSSLLSLYFLRSLIRSLLVELNHSKIHYV